MLEIKDLISLSTNDPNTVLSFTTRYLVQVNYTFDVNVRAGYFAGRSHFCVRKDQIRKFIEELKSLSNGDDSVKAILTDNDSNGFIEFTSLDILGHVRVSCQIGGSYEANYVKVLFDADQTALSKFIYGLESLLKYEDGEDSETVGH
jgi:hypothetical protein